MTTRTRTRMRTTMRKRKASRAVLVRDLRVFEQLPPHALVGVQPPPLLDALHELVLVPPVARPRLHFALLAPTPASCTPLHARPEQPLPRCTPLLQRRTGEGPEERRRCVVIRLVVFRLVIRTPRHRQRPVKIPPKKHTRENSRQPGMTRIWSRMQTGVAPPLRIRAPDFWRAERRHKFGPQKSECKLRPKFSCSTKRRSNGYNVLQ